MSSQILITGATGFIGRALTRDLVSRGDAVRVFARSPAKARALFGEAVEIATGDLHDEAAVARACRGISVVYHIAGSYRFGLRHRRELWASNVEGADNVFGAASAAGVDRVVHLSSAGVLARPGSQELLTEADFSACAPRWSAYKNSKWHAELRALSWAKRGLPVVIANTTCPLGPGDEAPTPTGRMIRDFLDGRFPFYCRTALNFIGVGDLSAGMQKVAERGVPGERYLICHENLWLKDFLDELERACEMPAPTFCLPDMVIWMAGLGGEAANWLDPRNDSARVCVETALQAGRRQFFSNERARRELGWEPMRTLSEVVREAVAWFRPAEVPLDLPRTAPGPVESNVP